MVAAINILNSSTKRNVGERFLAGVETSFSETFVISKCPVLTLCRMTEESVVFMKLYNGLY